ncbi:hypothetical protein AP058_01633 [Flavobacterium sp. TAB 87]|nr:hypothetical protein AP058_01633 [Flavobacterium sp. TAB 87]
MATSLISQEDADFLGLSKFNADGQSNANSTGSCTFNSIARAGSFINYNCASGGVGSSVNYSQIAGVATSLISQEDADSLGLTKFNTDGQSNANVNGTCTFSSVAQSGSFTRNNCGGSGVGSLVSYSQLVGSVTSSISQADADSQGLTKFNTDGQDNANSTGSCTFYSIARTGSFTRNNCAGSGVGSLVSYSQLVGSVTSSISQADADSQGLTKFNTNGQANANSTGSCTFYSIARTGSFTRNNCATGGVGSSVGYSQIAGVATSLISQDNADFLGLTKFNTDGQANANSTGSCTFYSIARTGSFPNYSCASGGVGSSVSYSQTAGVATSSISQADADSLGLTKFNTDGQSNANANGICTFKSEILSSTFSKTDCGHGQGIGSTVNYTQLLGEESSTISQADANAKGLIKFNADGRNYANANGYCFFYNKAKSGSFTKNNCSSGSQPGVSTIYTVAANSIISYNSQDEADSFAQSLVNSNGQSYANNNGTCNSIYFNAIGIQEILLRKMFITLTASSSNHNGHTFNIQIAYDTAQNNSNYKDVQLSLLAGETSKTFTVPVPAKSSAVISF